MPRLFPFVGLAFCAMFLTAPSLAQAAATDLNLAAKIDALTIAVNRLANVIDQQQRKELDQVHAQRLSQAIDYLNFRSRRIELLERDVAAARTLRENQEVSLRVWNDRVRELEEQLRNTPQGKARDELTRSYDEIKTRRDLFKDRMARGDDEILQLENRILELQNELVDIESFVQQNLRF